VADLRHSPTHRTASSPERRVKPRGDSPLPESGRAPSPLYSPIMLESALQPSGVVSNRAYSSAQANNEMDEAARQLLDLHSGLHERPPQADRLPTSASDSRISSISSSSFYGYGGRHDGQRPLPSSYRPATSPFQSSRPMGLSTSFSGARDTTPALTSAHEDSSAFQATTSSENSPAPALGQVMRNSFSDLSRYPRPEHFNDTSVHPGTASSAAPPVLGNGTTMPPGPATMPGYRYSVMSGSAALTKSITSTSKSAAPVPSTTSASIPSRAAYAPIDVHRQSISPYSPAPPHVNSYGSPRVSPSLSTGPATARDVPMFSATSASTGFDQSTPTSDVLNPRHISSPYTRSATPPALATLSDQDAAALARARWLLHSNNYQRQRDEVLSFIEGNDVIPKLRYMRDVAIPRKYLSLLSLLSPGFFSVGLQSADYVV
jgi:hypothetical protein